MGSQYIVPHPALVLRESFFDPASDAPDREAAMATAVTFAWEKAQDGLRAILEFGALLCRVEEWLKARPASERLGRNAAVSLRGWLSAHCPGVNYSTAMGYRAAALGLREAAKLAADRPLLPLMGEKPLTDAEEEAARQRVMGVIAASSRRLLKEAGRALPPAPLGGAREGAGRPKAPPPNPADDAVKVWTLAADGLRRIPDASYRFLPLAAARGLLDEIEAVRARLRARVAELERGGLE